MYKGYLLDLDGTIYKGTQSIEGAKEFVERLQAEQLPFLFVTNNTTKTPQAVQKNLASNFDIVVDESSIYTASLATADYLKSLDKGNRVYVIGESGLIDCLLAEGFVWEETTPDFVVVGLDRQFNYDKLVKATLAIQNGALFIGTNPDKNIPTEAGLYPGAGSLVTCLATSTQQEPIIIGKPSSVIMEGALQRMGLEKTDVVMVGDNYETDIQAGIQNDIATLLVLTGFTQPDEVPTLPTAPTHVLTNLAEWSF
ncbi:TIGR01457 family HAD-type hydrolase [Vagococcus zengguangii]|uniref:TIGR01457 family HAD-type hydrolase n=1 Tax=Vagococcus zengguangii TaxID=2571750 RepID=A0A4D7CU81_9ENTE|nr:TIGR01457 family HAD-type hydrolase [Vagococcus zengguangii]QCI86774.1 TIGR01457 family HAD-type hydrolase [Vagococcus zengguangii]TLG80380.1 TIGR01457 family HAD-type hydrolase [Vagococcus zengguangii]